MLRTVDQLVSDFGGMLHQLQGQHLNARIAKAQASGVSQLQGFATGLLKDYEAVSNGLTLDRSSGTVEGIICRLKAIKRACSAARTSTSSDARHLNPPPRGESSSL